MSDENEKTPPQAEPDEEAARRSAVAAVEAGADAEVAIDDIKVADIGDSIDELDKAQTKISASHGGRERKQAEERLERAKNQQIQALAELDDPNGKYTAFLWHGHVLRYGCNYCPFDTGARQAIKVHTAGKHPQPLEELGPARFDRWGRPVKRVEEDETDG